MQKMKMKRIRMRKLKKTLQFLKLILTTKRMLRPIKPQTPNNKQITRLTSKRKKMMPKIVIKTIRKINERTQNFKSERSISDNNQ